MPGKLQPLPRTTAAPALYTQPAQASSTATHANVHEGQGENMAHVKHKKQEKHGALQQEQHALDVQKEHGRYNNMAHARAIQMRARKPALYK